MKLSISRKQDGLSGGNDVGGNLRTPQQDVATEKIKHNVLNAKQHQREAEIVAEAGKPLQ